MWALMDDSQRERAAQRGKALIRWNGERGDWTAKEAANAAGVGLVRFYQMNAIWRTQPTLAALGVEARPPRPRSSLSTASDANLQAIVDEVVKADPEASVRQLALAVERDLQLQAGLVHDDIPSHNTLRAAVERALRHISRKGEAGEQLLLDHSACGLLRPDGSAYTMFAVIDRATQIVLGAAVGEAVDGGAGYASAARDALARIAAGRLDRLGWVPRIAGVQAVPALDGPSTTMETRARGAVPSAGFNWTALRKAGAYLSKHVGPSLGVLPIWPARTGTGLPPKSGAARAPVLDADKAQVRLGMEVDAHNDSLLKGRDAARRARGGAAAEVRALLSAIADSECRLVPNG